MVCIETSGALCGFCQFVDPVVKVKPMLVIQPTNPVMVATIVERGLYGGLARWLNMAKVPIKVVEADGTTKTRSYTEFTGDTTGMHIEIRMSNCRVSLVAPIRLNATRENLDRVQGHIPEDYYSRFDRYPAGKLHHLRNRGETGPTCAREYGFTKALAYCNWDEHENELACMQFDCVQRHYYADQRYHLLMKPPGGIDCINGTTVPLHNYGPWRRKRQSQQGELCISFGPTERLGAWGWSGFNHEALLQEMPHVRYSTSFERGTKYTMRGERKNRFQHAIDLHSAAEELLRETSAPFGSYNAIGLESNFLREETLISSDGFGSPPFHLHTVDVVTE